PAIPKPQVVSQPKPQQQQQQQQQQNAFVKVNGHGHNDFHPIYVKNITDKVSEEQLREALGKFGAVKRAALKQNKVTVGSEIVYAEERRPRSFQAGGRPNFQNGNGGINGHQGPQGGHRGRPARGTFQDRKPIQRPEKPAPTVAVN
ncbi:hypothetical protein BGX24_000524, partial [Mortierella sp. AD032]